jgi:hypothetical protein
MSAAIVAGAIAAAVMVVMAIAAIASASTSSSPTPQADLGNIGPTTAGTSSGGSPGSASGGITSSGTCFGIGSTFNGTAALPVSAASVAASIRQQSSSCYGTPISQITVTCGHQYTFTTNTAEPEGTISYTCNYSDYSGSQTYVYYVNQATGAWIEEG